MANMQLQRTCNAETFAMTAIDQKQSLAIVQTMLHGGLSSLAYLRNFFSESVFDVQIYAMDERVLPYEDYAAGNCPIITQTSAPATKMPVLRRNRSRRADRLLDWLEKGAFVALKDGNLSALQVYIHPDAADRTRVLETYTFTVKYATGAEGKRQLAGVQMGKDEEQPISVGLTNHALQTLLRQIISVSGQLPQLPVTKFLSMELFYSQDCDKSYEKNGWVAGTVDNKYFAAAEGWEKETQRLDDVRSGFHSTSFVIRHLRDLGKHAEYSPNLYRPPTIPVSVQFTESYCKFDGIDCGEDSSGVPMQCEPLGAQDNKTATEEPPVVTSVTSDQRESANAELAKTLEVAIITPAHTSDLPASMATQRKRWSANLHQSESHQTRPLTTDMSQADSSISSQSNKANMMRMALGDMMQPETFTQGDTQSQAFMHQLGHQGNEMGPSLRSATEDRPVLLRTRGAQLEASKESLRAKAHRLATMPGIKQRRKDELVLCQCGLSEEEGAMVLCAFCDTWQHLNCYGYTCSSDSRLPETHVCYRCLLHDNEGQEMQQTLHTLSQKRRGMDFALHHGPKDLPEIAIAMGLSLWDAKSIFDNLQSQGYVVPAKSSRKGKSSKVQLVGVAKGRVHEKMLQDLFDPMMHIRHFYQMPASIETQPTQRLPESQPDSMPPPVTPASRLRRKSLAQLPSSGLDLRTSLTPYKTPSRRSSRLSLPQKRTREDDDNCPSSADYRFLRSGPKRIRTVQTDTVLDVDGMSSSPAPR